MKHIRLSFVICAVITLAAVSAFSQSTAPEKPAAPAVDTQSKETSIYGEVQSVNAAAGTVSVQYYDYDSDSEKTVEIVIGKDVKMENAAAVGDIKKGDWVDVTYTSAEGKNSAKAVSVEKEESATEPAGGDKASAPAGAGE